MNVVAGHLRLLLVASASESITALARDLFLLDESIETSFSPSAGAALTQLDNCNFDAVAVDLDMKDDICAFLNALAQRHPRLVRLVIAADPANALFCQAAHLAHGLLPRPCDAATLYEVLNDTAATNNRLRDPALGTAVASILALPESPGMRRELMGLLADDEISIEQLEEAVQRNPAISAKLMQIANSAFYGARGEVTCIGEAVSMLGLDTVRGIVTSAHLFEALPTSELKDLPLDEIWSHCVTTAVMVRRLAWHVRASAQVNRAAFTAALLHDIGKVVMALAHGEAHARLRRHPETHQRAFWQQEERYFGHHHGVAGAMLLELWGLPKMIIEAVAMHHTPHRCAETTITPLALVHIANAIVHSDNASQLYESRLDTGFLQRLLLPAKLDLWRTAVGVAA
jgi:putative nucleotidyltransferase with HDIG domain